MADRRIFHLGVAGVAIATVISNVLSSGHYLSAQKAGRIPVSDKKYE